MTKILLDMDMPIDKISVVTGLSHNEIESLRKANQSV